jgi:hypothetical protein
MKNICKYKCTFSISWVITAIVTLILFQRCGKPGDFSLRDMDLRIEIKTEQYIMAIEKNGFRYAFQRPDGALIAPAHAESGLLIGSADSDSFGVKSTELLEKGEGNVQLKLETTGGVPVVVTLWLDQHAVKMDVKPESEGEYTIIARTGAVGPAYGMADHAAFGPGRNNLVLEDFVRDPLGINNGTDRMVSNFFICPQQGFAVVNMEPDTKLIRITDNENAQGSKGVLSMPAMYYFIGSPEVIYQTFLEKRNYEGYQVYKPKPAWFGVGWEAFGALAWMTNQKTVTENVDQYLDYGYPLSWMVVGSGFWPRGPGEFDEHGTPYGSTTTSEEAKKLQATTSFGMWDKNLYPDPKGMIKHFHDKGLIFTLGLRIGFIPGGPFTPEGVESGYFIKNEDGEAKLFNIGYPRVPIHLLDTKNDNAVDWYTQLCDKWAANGVDGYKEDLFGWPLDLPDDLIDPVNRALMDKGVYIMGRNNYLGSPADIHRYNDFNYNQMQDRGPINGLAYAFSGFPYVYPDIIGGTGLATGRFGEESRDKLRTYLIRYAQYAALNPSMAFGYGPWNFDEETNALCLSAARLHDRLVPFIYSNAIKAYQTGFPYTLTPLPLAYPHDPNVHGLADTVRRSYEWLIGESLLAAPLYGDDYATAFSRDIYLPDGKWMDYDDGKIYEGGQTLENFPIPIDKVPLFVGGTGIVVEKVDDGLKARIYPVTQLAETVFYGKDGETASIISIENPDWSKVEVIDKTNSKNMAVQKVRHAYEFDLIPGHDYTIQ